MEQQYTYVFDENPTSEKINIIDAGIDKEALAVKSLTPLQPCSYFIQDQHNDNAIVAGITGYTLFGSLYIHALWVEPSLRGNGYGAELMEKMEQCAKERNCTFATLFTMEWQALPFYQKLGYQIEFERTGYEQDSVAYFLRKEL